MSVSSRRPVLGWGRMMIIAGRELRQTVRTKSFWFAAILLPLMIVVGGAVAEMLARHEDPQTMLIVDPSHQVLPALRHAAAAHKEAHLDVRAAPDALAGAPPDRIAALAHQFVTPLHGDHHARAQFVVVIPPDFPTDSTVRVWSAQRDDLTPLAILRRVLELRIRHAALLQEGVSADTLARIGRLHPDLKIDRPKQLFDGATITRVMPVVLAFLLLIVVAFGMQWMLQAIVEERGGKLLEALLANVSPEELLAGKILSTLAAAMILFALWLGALMFMIVVGAPKAGMSGAQILGPLLSARVLIGGPFFILVGFLVLSVCCVTIGALCESLREAQGLMMPLMMMLIMPLDFLLQMQGNDIGAGFITVARWVPFWMPFLDLAALLTAPVWLLAAQGLWLLVFGALEFWVLNRVFRRALLRTGQRPGWREIIAMAYEAD